MTDNVIAILIFLMTLAVPVLLGARERPKRDHSEEDALIYFDWEE